jgi:hypothetical protein
MAAVSQAARRDGFKSAGMNRILTFPAGEASAVEAGKHSTFNIQRPTFKDRSKDTLEVER